mmetsp:Transcript_32490/g.85180  ORF Transcript_32490/g.85180 Transcript_32490/m.85180 type:complete len:353 (-) Transcript_32490:893-1951(-)
MVWQRLHRAVAPALPPALGAVAPVGPLAPGAILAGLRLAGLRVAGARRQQAVRARPAPVGGLGLDGPLALLLTAAARQRAIGPLRPVAQLAVLRRAAPALGRRLLANPGVAGLHGLEGRVGAGLPVPRGELRDAPVPLAGAGAGARAWRPAAPLRQLAVPVLLAGREVVADEELLSQSVQELPAVVRLDVDGAASRLVPPGAGRAALRPLHPVPPQAVHAALVAGLRVARGDLDLVQGLARLAALLGLHLHVACSALGASSARGRALSPLLPLAPRAVRLAGVAALRARGHLLQRHVAALRARRRERLDGAGARPGARGVAQAVRPRRPRRGLAVVRRAALAGLLAAGADLL